MQFDFIQILHAQKKGPEGVEYYFIQDFFLEYSVTWTWPLTNLPSFLGLLTQPIEASVDRVCRACLQDRSYSQWTCFLVTMQMGAPITQLGESQFLFGVYSSKYSSIGKRCTSLQQVGCIVGQPIQNILLSFFSNRFCEHYRIFCLCYFLFAFLLVFFFFIFLLSSIFFQIRELFIKFMFFINR